MFNSINVTGTLKLLGYNPRVFEVGETENSPVNFRDATAVAGAAICWESMDRSNPVGSLAVMVGGVVNTLFAYDLGAWACKLYDKWCHRVAAPLYMDEESEEYEILLKGAFERLKAHSCYPAFKRLRGFESDEAALFSYLKDKFKLGYCYGMAMVMLKSIDTNPHASSKELLKSVDFSQVFYLHFEHMMHAYFLGIEKVFQEKNRRLQGLVDENRANLEKWLDSEVNTQRVRSIIRVIETTLGRNEVDTEPFSIIKSFPAFCSHLDRAQSLSVDRTLIGRISVVGDSEERKRKDYSGGHTLIIQCSPGRYRYYDTIGELTGGFYEYDDKQEFYTALRYQLLNDKYDSNNPQVTLSIKKL